VDQKVSLGSGRDGGRRRVARPKSGRSYSGCGEDPEPVSEPLALEQHDTGGASTLAPKTKSGSCAVQQPRSVILNVRSLYSLTAAGR
jgi:hypothetical protein